MLLAGLYAVFFPAQALAILVIAGGACCWRMAVLGLWSLTFGGAKTGDFWFDVVRNVLAIITGVLILLSPFLATLLTATLPRLSRRVPVDFRRCQEIWVIIREREQ